MHLVLCIISTINHKLFLCYTIENRIHSVTVTVLLENKSKLQIYNERNGKMITSIKTISMYKSYNLTLLQAKFQTHIRIKCQIVVCKGKHTTNQSRDLIYLFCFMQYAFGRIACCHLFFFLCILLLLFLSLLLCRVMHIAKHKFECITFICCWGCSHSKFICFKSFHYNFAVVLFFFCCFLSLSLFFQFPFVISTGATAVLILLMRFMFICKLQLQKINLYTVLPYNNSNNNHNV